MDFKQFTEVAKQGQQAEGRIGGALRGGYVLNGNFHALGANGAIFVQPVEETREFRFAPYNQ